MLPQFFIQSYRQFISVVIRNIWIKVLINVTLNDLIFLCVKPTTINDTTTEQHDLNLHHSFIFSRGKSVVKLKMTILFPCHSCQCRVKISYTKCLSTLILWFVIFLIFKHILQFVVVNVLVWKYIWKVSWKTFNGEGNIY